MSGVNRRRGHQLGRYRVSSYGLGRQMATRLVYVRADGKWAWSLTTNGNVVATDGGQGYENESDARDMADRIVSGEFADAEKKVRRAKT